MKRSIKQSSDQTDNQYQMKVQYSLQYIQATKEFWNNQLINFQNEEQQQLISNNQVDIQKKQGNQNLNEIKNLQNFLLKIEQIQKEISHAEEKLNQKQIQNLHQFVLQNMGESLKTEENKSFSLAQSQYDNQQEDYQLMSYKQSNFSKKVSKKTPTPSRKKSPLSYNQKNNKQEQKNRLQGLHFNEYSLFQKQEDLNLENSIQILKLQQYQTDDSKRMSEDSQLIKDRLVQQQQQLKLNEEEYRAQETLSIDESPILNQYQKQIFKLQNKAQQNQSKSQNIYQRLQQRRLSSAFNEKNKNQTSIKINMQELNKDQLFQNYQTQDTSPFFISASPITRKQSAILQSSPKKTYLLQNSLLQNQGKYSSQQPNFNQLVNENEYFCFQQSKSDQQKGQTQQKTNSPSLQDYKLDSQLQNLKNSITQIKKQSSIQQDNENNTDILSARTRKSTIISSQTKKKYKSPPQTYLSSPVTNLSQSGYQFNKQTSILESYNFTYKSNFNAYQLRDINQDVDIHKESNNILLDYFGENIQEEQPNKQEAKYSIKSLRNCQTQMNSPNLRNIQSAREQNQSPSLQNLRRSYNNNNNYNKSDKQNNYFFSKTNNTTISQRKTSLLSNDKKEIQSKRKGMLFQDMLLTQSLSGQLQGNSKINVSTFQAQDQDYRSSSLTPRNEKILINSVQAQLQNTQDQVKNQSNFVYTSSDTIKTSSIQNGQSSEEQSKREMKSSIKMTISNNTNQMDNQDKNNNYNNCQNMIKLIENLKNNQKDKNNIIIPQANNLEQKKQKNFQTISVKAQQILSKQIQSYLKEKPQIRNILNKIKCDENEKVFLQQAQQIQNIKDDTIQSPKLITPHNNVVSIILSKNQVSDQSDEQSDPYFSQKQIKQKQKNLIFQNSNSQCQINEIISLKNIQSAPKENKSSKFITNQEDSNQNFSQYSHAAINSQIKKAVSIYNSQENQKIKQQNNSINNLNQNCTDQIKNAFESYYLGTSQEQKNINENKKKILSAYSQISFKKKKGDLQNSQFQNDDNQPEVLNGNKQDFKRMKYKQNANSKSIYQNSQINSKKRNTFLLKQFSKTNNDLPLRIEFSDISQAKAENLALNESQQQVSNRSTWIFKRIANRIQEQSNFVEKILQKENSAQAVPKIIIPSIQDIDSSILTNNDEKVDFNSKQNLSEIQEKQTSMSLSSKSQAQSSKSPIEKDIQAHQSFQDYIKLNSNQKSQFAQQQKLENSIEKLYKMNLSILSNAQSPKNLSTSLTKQSNQASPIRLEAQKRSQLKVEDSNYKIKLELLQQRSFKKQQENVLEQFSEIKPLDNSSKKISSIKQSQTIKDLTAFSSQNKLKSQFLAVPQNNPGVSQKRSSIHNSPQDFSSVLKNISRSFKIPQWAEQNQKKFPSFFNQQINTVQKKLYNITECFKLIFILNKFFKKVIIRVRQTLQLKNESEQKLQQQNNDKNKNTKEKPLLIKNFLKSNLLQNKILKPQSLTQSLQNQDSINSVQENDSQILSQKENLQIIRILKLKQFKEKAAQASSGMNEQGEPINKLIGFYPSLKFSSFVSNRLHVWKIYYVHKQVTSTTKISNYFLDKRSRIQTEQKEENQENPNEFQFQIKIDDQILKYTFKLSQNLLNILPGNNSFCSTLWPSAFWMFFHNLQTEKNFNIENDLYLNIKRSKSSSISSDKASQVYDQSQNMIIFKDEVEEDNVECIYDDITYKIYETQNNLKFLNFQANKLKKIFELQDIEYIGKLSYLLQQFGIQKGRIVSKINGKTIIFQDLPYDQQMIKYYNSILSLIKRYNIYFNECQDTQIQKANLIQLEKNQINRYLNSQKISNQLQIGLRGSIVGLLQDKIAFLKQNQMSFDKYFSYLQSKPHHILNMFLKKNKSYFLLSANLVFKYDLFQKYVSDKKIPFSIYVMARNMDMNSRVKPIEISQDKLLFFFSEHQIQQEIKSFLFRGSISKFWKINLIQICTMSLEIITNYQYGKQSTKNSKFTYYDQELYLKESINQMIRKNSYLRNLEIDEGQMSYGAVSDSFFMDTEQSKIQKIQFLNSNQNIFDKNFDDIYEKFYIQKREQSLDYNEVDVYNKDYQIKNDFDIIVDKLQNDSDDEDQRKIIFNQQMSQSLPKEVQFEIEAKYSSYNYTKSQTKTYKDNKKLTERLNNYLKERGKVFTIKNQFRGINFLFQIVSNRSYYALINKYKDQSFCQSGDDYFSISNLIPSSQQNDQIYCFLYDYEKKLRYFIIIQEKKQIKLLLNIIEMNLEGFLMEKLIVKQLQNSLLQELFSLKPDTNRYLKIQKYLKNINHTQREKKLRIDCPISVQYHLIVDSKQINNFYHSITRSYTLNFKQLGKCFVNASMLQIKTQDNLSQKKYNDNFNDDESSLSSTHQLLSISGTQNQQNVDNKHISFQFSTLLVLHIMPTNQRYKAYRLILSLADLREMDIIIFKHFQKDFFKESMLQRLVKLVSQQIIKIKTLLGSVLALSSDRVQTIHSASGKKVVLKLSRFNPYQDEDLMLRNFRSSSVINANQNSQSQYNQLEQRNSLLTFQEQENLAKQENKKWRVFIKQLKYTKNKVLKHEYELNDSVFRKKLMHEIIEPRRIILQRVQKFFNREYTLITVFRDVLKNIFVIQIYIPKTCRTIFVQFDMENLKQINAQIINQWIQQKLLFFHNNTQIPPFSSFLYFSQRIQATTKEKLQQIFENEKNEKEQMSIFKWQKINSDIQKKNDHKVPFFNIGTPKSIIKKKIYDELRLSNFSNSVQRSQNINKRVDFEDFQGFSSQAKNVIESNKRQQFKRSVHKKTCIIPNQVNQIQQRRYLQDIINDKLQIIRCRPQNLINYFKSEDIVKNEKFQVFKQITQSLDQGFQQRIENIQLSNMTRFIEMQIWDNIIEDIYFLPNDLKKDIMIMIGDFSFQVQELLHYENLNVDGKQDIQIDICINLIQSIQKPQSVKLRRQQQEHNANLQHMSPTFSLLRQQLLDFYFLPVEFIPYNATTDFNLQINNFQINEKKPQQITINLREIINVFIADGFYKSQSNYQNSRMNYSELKQLCYFILYKIKKQNFLDLIEKKKIKKPKQQNNLIIKGLTLMDKTSIIETPKKIVTDNFANSDCSSKTDRKRTFSFSLYPIKSPVKIDSFQSQDSSYCNDEENREEASSISIKQFDLNQSFLMSRNTSRLSVNFLKPIQLFLENSFYKKTILIDLKNKIFLSTTFYTLQNSFKFVVFRPGCQEKLEKIKNIMYFNDRLFSFKYFFQLKDYQEILRQATLYSSEKLLKEYKNQTKNQKSYY
ncbi:hypothetical protein TTHERM_00918470 (macronuclear) [Tetrahymena thermophila SB210]|uniref:Uncharacterized protein n=1 Tax=Tetrahymena thermophila (strain SB210) TaxID=312017 RepID=Q24IM8_TETTS|nr:hypothetical protein TTHERM_00918470 [Tetrahymena thermophila SB210]EAS07597.2 hypothetical protein TTHERM_00918470 [Tetrahymena thermophila SB210]|eukprot:XP_001027839.2 hypothetical protein TTHERM_00918470 [Tetrahymena thermophila SB210]